MVAASREPWSLVLGLGEAVALGDRGVAVRSGRADGSLGLDPECSRRTAIDRRKAVGAQRMFPPLFRMVFLCQLVRLYAQCMRSCPGDPHTL